MTDPPELREPDLPRTMKVCRQALRRGGRVVASTGPGRVSP